MPTFGAQQVTDPFPQPNQMLDLATIDQSVARNTAARQDLLDRGTLRSLVPGLADRDPAALAGAAVLPGGSAAVGALSNVDAQRLQLLEYGNKIPHLGGSAVPGGGGGESGPAPSGGSYAPGTPFTPSNLPPDISPDEDAMARTIVGEAADQGAVGQQAVAHVILNRAKGAGVTPRDVVFAPNQFEPWNGGPARSRLEALDPSSPDYQQALRNARLAASGQAPDPTGGATHFYAPQAQQQLGRSPPAWAQGQQPVVIGGHNFYRVGYGPQAGAAPVAAGSADVAEPGAPPAVARGGAQPALVARTGPPPLPPGIAGGGAAPAAAAVAPSPVVAPAVSPAAPAAAPGAAPAPDLDHALSVSGALADAILQAPAEQRAALWAQYRPIMLRAGAANAPEQYPGDAAVTKVRDAAMNADQRSAHLDAVRGASGAPEGAAPAAAVSSAPPAAAAAPAAGGGVAVADGVTRYPSTDAATAALGAGYPASPPLPNENPMLSLAAPASAAPAPVAPAAPAVAPVAPVVAPPGTGTVAPAAVGPAAGAGPLPPNPRAPPPGAMPIVAGPRGAEIPYTAGAQPGNAWYRLPNGQMSEFALPGASPKLTYVNEGGTRQAYDEFNRPYGPPQPISDTRRVTTVDDGREIHLFQGNTEIRTVPKGAYDLQKSDYERDAKELPAISDAGQQAQSGQIRLREMRDLASQISSGAGGGTRADWSNLVQTYLPDKAAGFIQRTANLPPAAIAQEFAKMALISSGTQERGVLGARGGYQAIKLFQSANPSLELQPDANRKILNMQLIGAQADADYARSALAFANQAGDRFRTGGNYEPITHFDQQWQEQRNPQIYAAAMGALNGDAWGKWTANLNMKSPADVQSVINIVRRASPGATVVWKDGVPHNVGQTQ
jgi:hypothetical protein